MGAGSTCHSMLVSRPARRTLLAAPLFLLAQSDSVPHYTPSHLACAVFHESLEGEARGQAGRSARREQFGREAVLVVRRQPADSGAWTEAWLDSLHVWRSGPGGTAEPDVDGLLGGRWVGSVASNGRWSPDRAPYVPEELAAVMDMRRLLDDFFPLLPGRALAPGAADTMGDRVIRRERPAGDMERFVWRVRSRLETTVPAGDSVAPVREEFEEHGTMVWSTSTGPTRWERRITTTIRPLAKAFAASRGVVSQRITVLRLRGHSACPGA